ncbi:MAG: hypothetical protein WC840_00340 [Candidatus Peribacteraceae bacterium]
MANGRTQGHLPFARAAIFLASFLLLASCSSPKRSVNSAEKIPFQSPQISALLLDSNSVRRIRFPNVRADHLTADVIHVVETGDVTESEEYPIEEVPLDFVINGGRPANYFGYKYTSQDAALERKNQNNQAFRVRFPGVFFASQRARAEDASHGGGIRKMEQDGGFTFAPTDIGEGTVRFSPNSLFVIVTNDPGGVIINMQGKGRCGDGWQASTEQCDDANDVDGDGCGKDCRLP